VILCGWCSALTDPFVCGSCGRNPVIPWTQRGQLPPTEYEAKRIDARRRLSEARRALGPEATLDAIAEHLNVSSRTVRRWHEMSGVRPSVPSPIE